MKKITYSLLMIFFIGIAATSCLKSEKEQTSPLYNAYALYVLVNEQNTLSLDPARVAMKLNMLLTTAEQEGEHFNDVTVRTDTVLKDLLFGSASTVIDLKDGRFTVRYTDNNTDSNDPWTRSGVLEFDTGGKLSKDMAIGDSWQVKCGENTNNYTLTVKDGSYTASFTIENPTNYLITKIGENRWMVNAGNIVLFSGLGSSAYKSDWEISLEVEQNTGGQTYEEIMLSTYTVAGYAQGLPALTDIEVYYSTRSALTYNMSCEQPSLYGGNEIIRITDWDNIDHDLFPAASMTMQWGKGESNCTNTISFSYNGNTLSNS